MNANNQKKDDEMKLNGALPLLESMTRQELRAVATALNVPRGKEKHHTIANLSKAIEEGKACVKLIGYISAPPAEGQTFRRTLFMKKLRTYKEDKVLQAIPSTPFS